jgi:hypothetical protein
MYVLDLTSRKRTAPIQLSDKLKPLVAAAMIAGLLLVHGLIVVRWSDGYVSVRFVVIASMIAGVLSFCIAAGRSKEFCGIMGALVLVTSAFFNPLATNLSHLYDSELAQEITRINGQSGDHPLWLSYGSIHPDTLIVALGGRALAGTQWPPQLSLWAKFDPQGLYRNTYNKYAQIHLRYDDEASDVSFVDTGPDRFELHISPNNPVLKEMGARYVLAFDYYQQTLGPANLVPIYKSRTGRFTIFEIPR